MLYILLLAAGFFPLIYGAGLLVDNATALAKRLNIPDIVIGLTIVGFGTSSPEMVVNIFASVERSSEMVLGNIIGSNLFNILVILGVASVIYPIAVKKNTAWKEIPLSFLAALVVFTVANDILIDHRPTSQISRIDGIIMLLFFTIFIVYNISLAKTELFAGEARIKEKPPGRSIVLLTGGLILLVGGGRLIVFSAVRVAAMIGMSERIIALTVVSVGTSLPELATSVIAALKKNTDIAIGNAIGSNIYNIFLVLGISAVINPVALQPGADMDMLFNIGASMLLFIFVFTGRGRTVSRPEGMIFLLVYALYITLLILK